MPRKKNASNGSQKSEAVQLAEAAALRGEELLDADQAREALNCFQEALLGLPTNQTAWYHRGVAAAEVWELEPHASDREQFLSQALESFRRVFELDSSTRSEVRQLASSACGKLLSRVAAELEDVVLDTDQSSASSDASKRWQEAFTEAHRCFTEAQRLHEQWGLEALDDECWGSWGEVLALRMRLEAAQFATMLKGHSDNGASLVEMRSAWMDKLAVLCEDASEKFSCATSAQVKEDDDTRWLTLHAEHLLAFVECTREAISACPLLEVPFQPWASKAETAWRKALMLADACVYLAGPDVGWEALALRADVFAAAAMLLSSLGPRMSTSAHLQLPDRDLTRMQVDKDAGGEALEKVEAAPYMASQLLDEAQAYALAEALYVGVAARFPEAVAVVGISLGEVLLKQAKQRRKFNDEEGSVASLRRASESFQTVTALQGDEEDVKEAVANAWYNLACVASHLGKPGHAAEALHRSFQKLDAQKQRRLLVEAREDEDLAPVLGHPDVLRAIGVS